MNARKREERLVGDQQQLEKLKNIKASYERNEMKDFQKRLKQNGLSNKDDLDVSEILFFVGMSSLLIIIRFLFVICWFDRIENDYECTESHRSGRLKDKPGRASLIEQSNRGEISSRSFGICIIRCLDQ